MILSVVVELHIQPLGTYISVTFKQNKTLMSNSEMFPVC